MKISTLTAAILTSIAAPCVQAGGIRGMAGPNALVNNPLIFTGHLDWDSENWYPVRIDVNDLQDVETECYSKCLADAQCTAIEFNLNRETTSNGDPGCWLWKGVPRFVEKAYENQGDAGIWLKKFFVGEAAPDVECNGDCDLTRLCKENRFRGFGKSIFDGCGNADTGRVCELYHGKTCSWVAVKHE